MNNFADKFNFLKNKPFILFESKIINLFKNLPKLPENIVNFLVSLAPYLVLVCGILSLLSIVTILSIAGFSLYVLSPFLAPLVSHVYLSILGAFVCGILLIISFNSLKVRNLLGWRLVFWSINFSILISLLRLNILSVIINAAISWYLLTQIKYKYN